MAALSNALYLALALLAATAANAADEDSKAGSTWSFNVENDSVSGNDFDYTSGLELRYSAGPDRLPAWGRWFKDRIEPIVGTGTWYFSYAVGHKIYTPRSTNLTNPPLDQRPYSAFLYGSADLYVDHGEVLDTFSVDLGIVGPSAGGEFVQNNFHSLIGVDESRGWDTQLRDEPVFRLLFDRTWRISEPMPLPLNLEMDLTPYGVVALGTAQTYAGAGGAIRVGQGLGGDYGPPRIRPGQSGPAFFDRTGKASWYLFSGLGGRVIGRNMFIEGNTFGSSRGLTAEPLVADVYGGAAIRVNGVELSYTHIYRSPQYNGQPHWNVFGSINARMAF